MYKFKNVISLLVICLSFCTFLFCCTPCALADDNIAIVQSAPVKNTDLSNTTEDDIIVNNTIKKKTYLTQAEKNVIIVCSSIVIVLFSIICILLVRK